MAADRTHTNWSRISRRVLGAIVGIVAITSPVSAQVGTGLCNTPFAQLLNNAGPPLIGIVVIGGIILAAAVHGYSGMIRDPEQVRYYRQWRDRALKGAIGAPLIGYAAELLLGWMGLSVNGCINITPFL
jgi:uncharacterized membrane protein YidH (DUF202 family)